MKRKLYSDEKLIGILKEHEAGASAADLARRYGVSEQSIYRWKSKFGGLEHCFMPRTRSLVPWD